jgi:hypothetical protein
MLSPLYVSTGSVLTVTNISTDGWTVSVYKNRDCLADSANSHPVWYGP